MADNDMLQGMQLGMEWAQNRTQNSLRMQQLRSEQAHRQAMERQAAQELSLKLEEFQMKVDQQANTAKAFAKYQAMTVPFLPGPNGQVIPNPMRVPQGTAAIEAFLPLAKDPKEAIGIAAQGALMNEREASGASLVRQRESSVAVNEARVQEIGERITQLQKGKVGVDPEWVRSINFLEQRRGAPFAPEELDEMWAIHSGQKARAGAQRPAQTEMEFITQQLPSARRAERQELKSTYRTDQQLIEELRGQYQELTKGQTVVQPEMQPSTIQPPAPKFQKGQRVIQNGVTYEFDGAKWNAVK